MKPKNRWMVQVVLSDAYMKYQSGKRAPTLVEMREQLLAVIATIDRCLQPQPLAHADHQEPIR